jgi:iron complex outermembrane receptor protein
MKAFVSLALASVSAAALASAASAAVAQPGAGQPAAAPAEAATLGEIVVTARRRAESLQEVPQTVNAVTSESLQKLNIRQFQDVQALVPGLSLQTSVTGFQNSASLRGVSFEVNTGAQPTVAFYMNDAPLQLSLIFQSLFDIGQIEVLKGPQGTTRGISAPSGAITITTHKPDLSQFGGYADVTLTDRQGRNAQGAINIPIVKDVLAVRVAGIIDTNNLDGVTSIHNRIRPEGKTSALRTSVSFEPTDAFNANFTYQHLDNQLINYTQVTGPGSGPFTIGNTFFPASVNPPLTVDQRAAVQDMANNTKTHMDWVTAQVDSRIFGQHFSYVGYYSHFAVAAIQESGHPSAGDVGNVLPGVAIFQNVHSQQVETTQEFRVASDPAPDRFFDYVVGGFYHWVNPTSEKGGIVNPGPLMPGAFGPSPVPDLSLYNKVFQAPITINIPQTRQETSLFGNITFHLPFNTELSGGIRHIWSVTNSNADIELQNAVVNFSAIGLPPGLPCSVLGLATGPVQGSCIIPSHTVISNGSQRESDTPNIYTVSLSHHFTRDFLGYVNTGTAFRTPVSTIGVQGLLADAVLPDGRSFSFHPAERSISYEIGFKSTWLDGRWRLNASMFRQRFTNFTLYTPNIVYNQISNPAQAPIPTIFDFTTSVNAIVKGFDIDTAFQVMPNWTISAQMSYADGKVQGSTVPCNITDAAGNPVFNTLNLISLCPGGSASRLPFWNATFQTEYDHPVTENADGFLRVLATYYPENKNRAEPNFTVPNYAQLNMYAGIRSHDGAWEASIFARNLLNTAVATDIAGAQTNLNASLTGFPNPLNFASLVHPTGYFQTITTPPREVGINVHYAWGSR